MWGNRGVSSLSHISSQPGTCPVLVGASPQAEEGPDPVTGPPEGPQSWHMLCAGGKQPQPWKVGKLRPERQRDLALHAG